jgi:hypothetical protein
MLSYIVQYEKRSKLIRYLLPTHSYEVLVVEPHAPFRLFRVTGESGRMSRPELMSESEMTRWVSRKERMGGSGL